MKMSQSDILDVLEKANKPLSRAEISSILNERPEKVSMTLNKLIEHNEIKFKEINRIQVKFLYGSNAPSRRLRVYFV